MAYKISKDEIIKPSAAGIELSDGLYAATIVGYLIHKKEPFEGEGSPFDAIRFAMQLVDDQGNNKVIQTNDLRISLAEKSKLFIQLAGWVKAASPNDLWERLEKSNFMDKDGNLNFDKFLGTHPSLMVKMVPSKKDPAKTYPDFTFCATKKGQEHQIDLGDWNDGGPEIPLWISDFIEAENVVDTSCLEGFEWKRYEKKEDDAKADNAPKTREERVSMPPRKQVQAKVAAEPEVPTDMPNVPESDDVSGSEVAVASFDDGKAIKPAPKTASQKLTIKRRHPVQRPVADTTAVPEEALDTPF